MGFFSRLFGGGNADQGQDQPQEGGGQNVAASGPVCENCGADLRPDGNCPNCSAPAEGGEQQG